VLNFLRRNRLLLVSGFCLVLAAGLVMTTGRERSQGDILARMLLEGLAPLQRASAGVGGVFSRTWNGIGEIFRARAENVELRTQVRGLQQKVDTLTEIEIENARLRQLLEFREKLKGSVVTARVIGYDAAALARTLVIDRGESDGVVKGAAVIVPEGIVGQVFVASPNAARVLLVTDSAMYLRTVQLRALSFVLVGIAVGVVAGCGGDRSQPSAPPGSPENPLIAQHPDSGAVTGRSNAADEAATTSTTPATRAKPDSQAQAGSEGFGEHQARRSVDYVKPCELVTRNEARAILGEAIRAPLEAPQGPTCIYRPETRNFVLTLAVQSVAFKTLAPLLGQPRRIRVAGRIAYCGQYGHAMLYVPLSTGRLLSIAAPCLLARQFAARAIQRLGG